ncbi:solute carrier family 45 member 3-like [Ischnura elegans]|uniref:solute carrier family 45 member 3-like n=1 Tax=Ischnura elegans TaxID=197161 RepID=UPI001ED8949B|nr:solute carrier family 45 member 3-like [Ischnura elegans]
MGKDVMVRQYSLAHLMLINSVVCGLEVSASVGYTYLPPLLLKAGFCAATTGFILGIGPLLALLSVPHMGRVADKSRWRLGRRRPVIFMFAAVLSTSLITIIIGQKVVKNASGDASFTMIGAGLLMIGGVLLDYSSQAAFNPCEALLSDLLEGGSRSNVDAGFAVYSGLLSLGACLGYLITAVRWPRPLSGSLLGGQEGAACGVALALLLASVVATGVAAKEESTLSLSVQPGSSPLRAHRVDAGGNILCIAFRHGYGVLPLLRSPFHTLRRVTVSIFEMAFNVPRSVYTEVKKSPVVLQRLFVADVSSWAAITCHALFYTNYVGQVVYGGSPVAGVGTLHEALYNEGVRMGSWGLLLHSLTACGYTTFLQDQMIRNYGLRWTYLCGLMTFSACMFGILVSSDIKLLNLFAAFSGVGFAAITTIPNSLVAIYRSNQQTYFFDVREDRGSGEDFAVLDLAYYLGQILLSVVMSYIGQLLGQPQCYIIFAGLAGLASCYFANKVIFSPCQLSSLKGFN